ncbi:MAG: mRNA surveillance protein pelota [Candidatus Nanohaloarchaea archaeon]|nr:mRNA surveillance protein pelota [Candidatus Nanohaloarchaea archaeon]
MDVLGQDRGEGYMELEVESDADLWHLRHVVEPGDVLRMDDRRTTIEGGEKRLRATGEIREAPDDVEHGYHTFNLEKGVTVEIWKEAWSDHQLDRIDAATETEDYEVLVCMVDGDGANFAVITETGIRELSDIESGTSGKMYRDEAQSDAEFYDEVISVLETHDDVDHIIVAGPGFEKENVVDRLDAEGLDARVWTEDASTTGQAGVQEVIKRGAVDRVLEASRIGDETAAVEAFLDELHADGDVTYGEDAVVEAAEMGAVEQLLITDGQLRQHEDLVETVEQQDGAVQIVHEDHDAGKKLASLGGIAAVLRYGIE